MRIFVDIDATIARESARGTILTYAFMAKLSEQRKREALACADPEAVLLWPELIDIREKWGADEFRRRYQKVRLMPMNLLIQEPIEGALEGVQRLSQIGDVVYATARRDGYAGSDPDIAERAAWANEKILEATQSWLASQGFPEPNSVLFVTTLREKLERIAAYCRDAQEATIFIDDMAASIVEASLQLPEGLAEASRTYLTFVPYSLRRRIPDDADTSRFARVVMLRTWKNLEEVLSALDIGGYEHVDSPKAQTLHL